MFSNVGTGQMCLKETDKLNSSMKINAMLSSYSLGRITIMYLFYYCVLSSGFYLQKVYLQTVFYDVNNNKISEECLHKI